jgi:hypothetical protein
MEGGAATKFGEREPGLEAEAEAKDGEVGDGKVIGKLGERGDNEDSLVWNGEGYDYGG